MYANLVLSMIAAAPRVLGSLQIVSGGSWTASNTGLEIEAHGGQVIQSGSSYYWIGEDHADGNAFTAVNCYTSSDLVDWTFVRALLSQESSGDLGPDRVVERPKIIYNPGTNQYVMYMYIDSASYGEAKVGVATSSSLCGSAYSYLGSWQPLGYQSRDMSLFQDDDGSAYLLTEDRANGLRIDALTSNYLNVSSAVYLYSEDLEAPAMYKKNGVYFMFASYLSGWSPNNNVYSTASSLSGPWTTFQDFAPAGTNTFSSQTAYILPVGDDVMYMGDRWNGDNLVDSTYVWLPLDVSGTTASMPTDYVNWLPTTFQNGPSENSYQGEAATLTNGAKVVSCSGCSGGEAAGYIGGPSNGAAMFTNVQSDATTRTTVRIRFENGDSEPRFANVMVNGVSQTLAFLPSPDGNTPADASLNCNLIEGSNTVEVSGINGGYGPDIDMIYVPVD